MANRNDLRWQNNYEALKAYIEEHHYLPDKRKVENRKLVNWWKYNRRRIRLGKIDPERARKLEELSNMRWLWGSRGLFVSRNIRRSILWTWLDLRLRRFDKIKCAFDAAESLWRRDKTVFRQIRSSNSFVTFVSSDSFNPFISCDSCSRIDHSLSKNSCFIFSFHSPCTIFASRR